MDGAWVRRCGLWVEAEPTAPEPAGFWPVARALGALGGVRSLTRAAPAHHGRPEAALRQLLGTLDFPVQLRPATARQARATLNGALGGPKRTRRCLARAFLALFQPGARHACLRSDAPHGAGVLITDSTHLGLLFAECRWNHT